MTEYENLVDDPGVFVQSVLSKECWEHRDLQGDISAVLLRMGEFKYRYFSPLFEALFPGKVFRMPSDRKEEHCLPRRPELTAVLKADEHDVDIVDEASSNGISCAENELVLSVGQDVQLCTKVGIPIHKPYSTDTKENIVENMIEILCRDKPITLRLISGLAVFGRNNTYPGKGVAFHNELRFTISPFTSEELCVYVGELSLVELRQTNGGFRWPHPIFSDHIIAVNEVRIGDEGFNQEKTKLFMGLIGVDTQSLAFLSEAVDRISSLSDVDCKWDVMVALKNGSLALMREIDLTSDEEVNKVSQMIIDNFDSHYFYNCLSSEAREEYKRANDAEGIIQTCSHPNTLMAKVIVGQEGILAYAVLRQVEGRIAELKRLHVKRDWMNQGLATLLLEEVEAISCLKGCQTVAVNSSGKSHLFFEKRGYLNKGMQDNRELKKRGVLASVHNCLKSA